MAYARFLLCVCVATMGLHCDTGVLSRCGEQALKCVDTVGAACGILVPWSEIKPASSALESGFSTTGPPGKSPC